MIDFILDPVIIITFVVSIVGLFIFWRFKNSDDGTRLDERTTIFIFSRNGGFQEKRAKTFDGLVTYENGGFVEDGKCIIPLFFGRSGWFGSNNPNSIRGRVLAYFTRPGDAGPLDFRKDDLSPDNIAKERFEAFSSISVEREVNKGKLEAGKALFSERLIAIAAFIALIMAVITWATILILPLTPLPEKSADGGNPIQNPTAIPNQEGIFPTPFVPVNYLRTHR